MSLKSLRLLQLLVAVTFLFFKPAKAQSPDSLKNTKDTIVLPQKPLTQHSPKRAAVMSAILPGAGQVYNKKYWKVPLIYAGIGALAYSFDFNEKLYVKYRNAYRLRVDDDPSTNDIYQAYTDDELIRTFKYYHRYRDLSVIGIAAVYLLNVVDASVDAHLYHFNVSDDLSLNIAPSMIGIARADRFVPGLTLNIKF